MNAANGVSGNPPKKFKATRTTTTTTTTATTKTTATTTEQKIMKSSLRDTRRSGVRSKKKSVHWNTVRCRISYRGLDKAKAHLFWYRDEDIEKFHEEIEVVRQMVQALGSIQFAENTDFVTARGLEAMLSKVRARERLQVQALAWDAVLDEQEEQWDNDEQDPEAIAYEYHKISAKSQLDAHMRAVLYWEMDQEFLRTLPTTPRGKRKLKRRNSKNRLLTEGPGDIMYEEPSVENSIRRFVSLHNIVPRNAWGPPPSYTINNNPNSNHQMGDFGEEKTEENWPQKVY